MKKQKIFPLIFLFIISLFLQGCGGGSYSSSGSSLQKGYVDIQVSYPQDKAHKTISYYLIDIFDNENMSGDPVVPTTRVDYPETKARITDVPVGKKWVGVKGFEANDSLEEEGYVEIDVEEGENAPVEIQLTPISSVEYEYVTKWYGSIAGGNFQKPMGMAVNSWQVFVTDEEADRIQIFDLNGGYLHHWGSYGTQLDYFNEPMGIALDNSGFVYVADNLNNRVQIFDSSHTIPIREITGIQLPWGVAVDSSRQIIYVASNHSGEVQRFDFSMNPILPSWTGLSRPEGIAVDSLGNVIVTDRGNSRLVKYAPDGTILRTIGSSGAGDGEFNICVKVAVDAQDNIYVIDSGNNRVQKFDSNGNFITKWGKFGSGDGEMIAPTGICVDNQGNVYVAEIGNNRVQKFRPTR